MGQVKEGHEPVVLFTGVLYRDPERLTEVRRKLVDLWGPVIESLEPVPFRYTDYYREEMGEGLKRTFLVFEAWIQPGDLPKLKLETNEIERALASGGRRTVNLDPGYLSLAKVVLATTKDFAHRLYLDRNIYGEVTLVYTGASFRPLDWTYPDYKEERTLAFFNHAREDYRRRLRSGALRP